MKNLPRDFLPYGASVLAVLLAAIITWLLASLTSNFSPLFMAAVMLSAWYGGLGPGLLATALSVLAIDCLFLPPVYSIHSGFADATRLAVFGLVAALISSLYAARKRAEGALSHALLRERAALAEAEEANINKEKFLTFLAHELRTPLAAVRNFVQILDEGRRDSATLEWGRGLLKRQVQQMGRLLEDLLDVSRIDRGKIELRRERLDLTRLLRAMAGDHLSNLQEARLNFDVELPTQPVWVIGDPTRLTQIANNLLVNAGKFTDAGGTITLRLGTTDDGRWAVLTVQDTGVGIEPAMLSHVFDMFAQAEQTRGRSNGGLGFGLALVKGLVELHYGKVEVASAGPGQGTAFTVWLPLQREPEEAGTSHLVPSTPMPDSRVSRGVHATV